ncbi:MAG: NAD-dependent epimerase/dehydratase family protein [Candidatus Micrarchaeota archaeon]
MKILVTGALGFIGSNLTERLVKEGHEVTALDNLHTGSESNLESVKEKVRIVKKNAGEVGSLGEGFDAIFHQGIYSSSPMYKENPRLTATVLDEWLSILEYARKHGGALVYASSSSLYNRNLPPHREDMEIFATDFYTEGRFSMERLAKIYSELYGVKSVGLRYFSVYGPHERSKGKYANLVTQFLWSMQKGESPLIFGDGKQTRDFISVEDVVEANIRAMSYRQTDVFNVGTGRSASLNEVVDLLNSELGTSIKASYKQNPIKNYVQHTQADTSKAEDLLGFSARTALEDGVKRLIKHYAG